MGDDTILLTVLVGEIRGEAVKLSYEGETGSFPLSLIEHSAIDVARMEGKTHELELARWKARKLGWAE